MRTLQLLLFVCVVRHSILLVVASQMLSEPLQLLEKLGFHNGLFGDSSRVTLGKGKRKGDSPVYYIKLPPAYNPAEEPLPRFPPTKNTLHRLDVDFTTNGKPSQIYHWNYKPHVPMNSPLDNIRRPIPTPGHLSNEVFNTISMPPEIPLLSKITRPFKVPAITFVDKPLIALRKNFFYNGKPNGVYVWKPRPSIRPAKYRHPYFKHFNY